MEKVYVAGAIPEVGLKLLQEHFEVEMYEGKGLVDKDTLIKGVKDATALIVYYLQTLIKMLSMLVKT